MSTPRTIIGTPDGRSPTESDFLVGSKIKTRRRERGLTQQELGREIGVTGAQIHRYEAGTTRIAASRLIAIAEALNVDAQALLAVGQEQSAEKAGQYPAQTSGKTSDELAELVRLFTRMTDPHNRSALIALARMFSRTEHPTAQP